MLTRPLGRTGLNVSILSYGAMEIGRRDDLTPSGASRSLLLALEKGVTCVDTARAYGESENVVGHTLREWNGKKPVVLTKIAPLPTGDWRRYNPLALAFTPESIRSSVEASLKALQADCLDLIQLHQWYYLWTHEPAWIETFKALQKEGKIAHFGISAQDHEHDAVLEAVDLDLIETVQFVYNIFESRPLTSLVPVAEKHGLGLVARCVLDSGGLSGSLSEVQIAAHEHLKKGPADLYGKRIAQLKHDFADVTGSLLELALRFAMTAPAISTVALSMPDTARVEANLAAAEKGVLPPDVFRRIALEYSWVKNFWNDSAYDHS